MKLEASYESVKEIKNYINGELVSSESGQTLPNYEPATGKEYSRLPASNKMDVDKAVESAKQAFPSWSNLTATERADYLRRLADAIAENLETFIWAESVDNGKPVFLSRNVDIPRCSYNLRFFADAITQFSGETYATSKSIMNYINHQPLGVVSCISPWNLPLYSFTWKVAPALAAGNCVVAKPSEVTPLTAFLFSKLCGEILPPGVLNIVHGLGNDVGGPMSIHPDVRAVSFTGSTVTGRKIAQATAPLFKKTALEMGGKNPTVIFADCDFEKAVAGAVRAAFTNQGQVCLCGSRILVEEKIYEKFKSAVVGASKKLKNDDPLKEQTRHGAVVSKEHFKKVMSYISLAKEEGGRILCGGDAANLSGRCEEGWFIQPTLIEGLSNMCRTNQEEIFGPVASLQSFSTESQAVHLSNETEYGLSASVWTSDLSRAHRMAQNIDAGVVWVNTWMSRDLRTPFGGTKNSGLGREGGMEALHFFTEPKNMCVEIDGGMQ